MADKPCTDPAPPQTKGLSGLERARQLYPGRRVTHTRFGVWDYYEEKAPKSGLGRLLVFPSFRERYSDVVQCAPYVVRMVKDVLSIPGCRSRLGAYVVLEMVSHVVPAIALWYQGQLLKAMEAALGDSTVDTDFLVRICIGRMACTVANMALQHVQSRIRNSLNGRIRGHFAVQSFRSFARLDVPTFSQQSVQAQLSSAWSNVFGTNAIWRAITVLTGTAGTYATLGTQLLVLWNALKSQRNGTTLAVVTMISEVVPFLYRMPRLNDSGNAWAVTTTDKDYIKMQGWSAIVKKDKHRKEFVAGNLLEYATSEYASAARRVGDNDEDWTTIMMTRRSYEPRNAVIGMLPHLPQIAFTIQALKRPSSLPASLASLNLVQTAARSFAWATFSLFQNGQDIGSQLKSVRDMYEVGNIQNTIPDGSVSFPGGTDRAGSGVSIEFMNVSFKYPKSKKYALRNVSFKLLPGQLCVIVGTNGAGKSTILKLIVRLYDFEEGQILFGGHDIRTLKLSDLRQAVSVLFQDYTYFPLSIRDNIALGDPAGGNNDESVREAARLSGADTFIDKLSEGFDTFLQPPNGMTQSGGPPEGSETVSGTVFDTAAVLEAASMKGPSHTELSGGQMQRLAVARTFMRSVVREDSPVGLLLLDEPSASLDPAAEHALFDRLRGLRGGKTMIFSSHRFGNLTRHADLIIYMDESGVVELGSHAELLNAGGEYARLWTLQAEAFT